MKVIHTSSERYTQATLRICCHADRCVYMYSIRQTHGIMRSRAICMGHACDLGATRVQFACDTRVRAEM